MMLLKCCIQYASKFEKHSSGHRTEKFSFHSILKKGNGKEYSNHHTIAFISHSSKAMPQILQARLQLYMNCELQAGSRKDRGTRDQIADIHWLIEKARELKTNKQIYFSFIDYVKDFHCVDHNKLWKTLREGNTRDHLTNLLRNLYAGQEATVRTRHGTMDSFKIGERVRQGYILSPCLFHSYAEYIL